MPDDYPRNKQKKPKQGRCWEIRVIVGIDGGHNKQLTHSLYVGSFFCSFSTSTQCVGSCADATIHHQVHRNAEPPAGMCSEATNSQKSPCYGIGHEEHSNSNGAYSDSSFGSVAVIVRSVCRRKFLLRLSFLPYRSVPSLRDLLIALSCRDMMLTDQHSHRPTLGKTHDNTSICHFPTRTRIQIHLRVLCSTKVTRPSMCQPSTK